MALRVWTVWIFFDHCAACVEQKSIFFSDAFWIILFHEVTVFEGLRGIFFSWFSLNSVCNEWIDIKCCAYRRNATQSSLWNNERWFCLGNLFLSVLWIALLIYHDIENEYQYLDYTNNAKIVHFTQIDRQKTTFAKFIEFLKMEKKFRNDSKCKGTVCYFKLMCNVSERNFR